MKRLVILTAVAGSLMIASAVAVFLLRAKPVPSAGAPSLSPSANAQTPPRNGQAATAAIAADKSASPTPAASPATPSASSDGDAGRKRLSNPTSDPRLEYPAEEKIQRRIVSELRDRIPEVVPLLTHKPSYERHHEKVAAILHTLDVAQATPANDQPPLLLAADFLAGRLNFGPDVPPTPESKRELEQLAHRGLTYRYSDLGSTWAYSHDLLWRVWRDFPSSSWAEDALLLLLEDDWDPSGDCTAGPDSFRVVIRQGEDFLAGHPQSRYRRETLYLVAQAYETWWSLSRAKACQSSEDSDCDFDVNADSYRQGAEEARGKAVGYYGQVLEMDSSGPLAEDARLHLDALKRKLDTAQRRFYCIIMAD
jgi:hypothetical protein